MNTSFEKSKNSTDEWYTPKEIIDALGEFDLDPCAPMRPLWRTARVMYNKEQDGLKQKWEGRVWLNPPYSRPTIEHFITRMVEHNNGIALLFNRLDNKMFQDVVFPKAKGILFMKGRIKFHREDGTIGESPGCGSILVAFGEENAETLRSSNIEGRYIQVNQEPCNTHVDWEQRRYEMAIRQLGAMMNAYQCRFVVSSGQLFFVDDEYAGTVKLTNLDNGESNISFPSCDDGLIINPADKHIK